MHCLATPHNQWAYAHRSPDKAAAAIPNSAFRISLILSAQRLALKLEEK